LLLEKGEIAIFVKNSDKVDMGHRLTSSFFERDARKVAPELLGKTLVRRLDDGTELRGVIVESEAYFGEEDKACHASKGRTARTEVMYATGGKVYVYFIYGMYWLFNVVTGSEGHPQAVLIRGVDKALGPGRVGKWLQLDRSFYGEDITMSQRLWIENSDVLVEYSATPRVGVEYAGEEWSLKPWRFIAKMP
jgi:DNA-3-methyladenine glycosylase